MIIWLPILWMATGVCLFAGLHFLHAGRAQANAGLFHAFGVVSLTVAVYIGVGALLQSPAENLPWALIERLHVAAACLIWPTGFWFISLYSRLRNWRPWVLACSVIFGILLVLDLAGSHSLLLARVTQLEPMVLPWGERVARITGTPAALAPAFYLATLAAFCWAFWRCVALWKAGDARRAKPLAAYLLLQAIASGYAEYYTLYPRPVLSWDALPFLALVLLLSRTLNIELRGYAAALDASNIALREENTLRGRAEAELRSMAYNDAISGLSNRHALNDWLAATLATAPMQRGALVVVDPQRFATINHALGHRIGDLLIREIGKRLSQAAGAGELVARLSGDEFAVALLTPAPNDAAALEQALQKAENLRKQLVEPLQVGPYALSIATHIGLAMFRQSPGDGDALLRQAYVALHAAKKAGGTEPVAFAQMMQAQAERRLRLEIDLRGAIENQQVHLVYQPQVDRDGRLVGAEALLRWEHPSCGAVSPAEFVGIAEDSGQMPALGRLVLHMAFSMLAALPDRERFRLSVNVSPRQLFLSDFLETVRTAIRETAVDPHRITLEITETTFIHDVPDTVAKLRALDAMGIHVSIDDFGTGYASVALMKTLPLHELKIDQAFIHDMSIMPRDRFVAALIALGEAMHLRVVAEGVEREEQREALAAMGCHVLQGYLIGWPAGADALLQQMREEERQAALRCLPPDVASDR